MSQPIKNTMINGVSADYLSINDRAIHYGDGLFETILCSHNKLLYWKQHYQRLKLSSIKLKLNCPDEALLLDDIKKLLGGIECSDNHIIAIKIIVSRGAGERGYQFSKGNNENRIVMLSTLDAGYSPLHSGELSIGDLYVCEQQVSINESLAGIKHLNRLENVLARNEWQNSTVNNNIIDGLMVNANGHVIECTMSNLFAVKDKHLLTPDLKLSGINGIMRDLIINIARENNIEVASVNLTLEEIFNMDELFITNSLIGMKAVNKIVDQQYLSHSFTNLIFNELLKTKDHYAQSV